MSERQTNLSFLAVGLVVVAMMAIHIALHPKFTPASQPLAITGPVHVEQPRNRAPIEIP